MGNCIICGAPDEGPVCDTHQEDVVFEFEGDRPDQLTPGRYYKGTVDGYADFGVFIDIGPVTGLLHRSKIDRRIESLDWDSGDTICVQVESIRDNGDIDLGWSIRQEDSEFRGVVVDAPDGDYLAEEESAEEVGEAEETPSATTDSDADDEPTSATANGAETASEPTDSDPPGAVEEPDAVETAADEDEESDADTVESADEDESEEPDADTADSADEDESEESDADLTRVPVEELRDRVGDSVRLEGAVASVRQTSGPTVFELRDETGVVDCAAFVEAGVRAYPEIEADAIVRLDGEVRLRRDEIQVETESLVELEGEGRETVESRMEAALDAEASPDSVGPLTDDDAIEAVSADVETAATAIRRAVLESRPVVVRHDATTDGYVAGAAIERAVLPLVTEQHASADAVYHYFDRRPLEDGVYDMNDATKDVTRMLGDRERHDEKLPLFVFAAAGSTAASADGLEFLELYDAPRIVVDSGSPAAAIEDDADFVTVPDRSATTIAATIAAAVNDDVRSDLLHLPAVSYWEAVPSGYEELAADAAPERIENIRKAVALQAYYQSYEDKRELIADLLFGERTELAAQIKEQFERKLDAEIETALANVDERTVDGTTITVLDTDAYTHRFDFPPTRLLLDELHRRLDADAVVGVATDELHIRSDTPIDTDSVVESLREAAPNAGVVDPGARDLKLEFLAGERDAVLESVVDSVTEQVTAASA
ncbi:MAG: OB-fold nucleic acid binding domain-containing protein [Natronomonas sp.]